jgi:putative ABC transport system permease protein
MRKLRALWFRILGLFSRRREQEFADELQSHLELHIADALRYGLTPEQAGRQALLRLRGAEQVRQAYRERATLPLIEIFLHDIRYALRGFARNPIFAITAVLTLALGIGVTTAVFGVVDRILFRPLPYAHPDRLVSVGLTAPIIPQEFLLGGSYYDWRDNQKAFVALTSDMGVNGCDLTERNPAHLGCAAVEANFLSTLGVSPILGRNFLPEEDRPKGPKVALISYGLWRDHYGADPQILNRQVDIDGAETRVIGVLPGDFEMPALEPADVLVPEALDEAAERKADPGHVLYAFARLKPGITIPQAVAELQPVFNDSLSVAPPRFRSEVHLRVRSLRDRQMQDAKLAAWILLAAVLAVLLISAANVASLMLVRAAARERDLDVRAALGASRWRLLAQAFIESLLLCIFGAAAGCALAAGIVRIFVRLAPSGLPFLQSARLDVRFIGFSVLVAIVSGLIFGLLPGLAKPRSIPLSTRTWGTPVRARLRQCLVAAQLAISIVLLASAALLLRSFVNLESQPLGMQTHGVITAAISLNRYRYTTPQSQMQYFAQVESALRRIPGADAVALSDSVPPGGHHDQIFSIMSIKGHAPLTGGTGGMVAWRWVTPEYFKALGIPIVRGRPFTTDQRSSPDHALILSSLLAARLFPNEDPIGQQIRPTPNDPWYTVQAIAANVKTAAPGGDDEPEFYRLRRNLPEDWQSFPSAISLIRTVLPPKAVTPWVQSEIAAVDSTVPVDIEPLTQRVSNLADRPRFETALLGFFAITGLLLAAIGLYGVVAYRAAQRIQEIGVRMAVGAGRLAIIRLVLGEGMRIVLIGGSVGLLSALALSRLLKTLLFSIGPHDPVSFVAVAFLLAFVAVLATLVPAIRAASINPTQALRAD